MNFLQATGPGGLGGAGGLLGGLQSMLARLVTFLIGLLTGGLLGNLLGGQTSGQPMSPHYSPGFGSGGCGGCGCGGGSPSQNMARAAQGFLGHGGPTPSGHSSPGSRTHSGAPGGGSSSGPGSGGGFTPTGPVAPGVDGMLDHARSMLGLHEGRDRAAIQRVTGKSGINPSTTPWCAAFAMNMLKDHGVLDTSGLSNPNYCPTIKNWASSKGIYGKNGQYTPKPGDAILFDWQANGREADHIGIVEKVENGRVYTIEGNSKDSVKRNSYPVGSSKIDGYVITGKKKR